MKYLPVWILMFSLACAGTAQADGDFERILGKDWPNLSDDSKTVCILNVVATLRARGILLTKSTKDYLAAIDWMLIYEPKTRDMDVEKILIAYLYTEAPETRKALDALENSQTADH